jgi:2-polyprenyl-3-methyl-5-hydroxy-6-metoxy-1,4-benzoquinol methylase
MAGRKSIASQFSEDSSRYHYEVPDWQLHPDPKNRTWVLLNWVGRDKRVLELGCSTGYMSKYMVQNQNCSVIGIELDRAAAQQAAKFCREVHVRNLNNADRFAGLDQQSFDVVLMGDVLEHLTDPRGVLIQIRKFLDHNARIVVCLPNVLHWLTRIKILLGHFDYEPSGTLDYTHLRFFTVKTSRELIEGAGYRVTKFRPAFGGRFCGRAQAVWQSLADWFPGLFAFQLLYEAEPLEVNARPEASDQGELAEPVGSAVSANDLKSGE